MKIYQSDYAYLRAVNSSARVRREEKDIQGVTNGLSYLAVKNEYESAQVVITAKRDLVFSAQANDLTNENGEVLSKDCFELFYEKYVNITRNWHKNGAPIGDWPDALIPVHAPILRGENEIKAGNNGALWVDVKVPKEQPAGTYRGTLSVFAGEKVEIDVCVEVLNVTLRDETTSKSMFTNTRAQIEHFDGTVTQDLFDRYSEYLIDHRVSPTGVCVGDREIDDEWADKLAWAIERGASTVGLPSKEEPDGMGKNIFEAETLERAIVKLSEKSLSIGKNLVKHAAFYDWLIDEPFGCNYKPGKVEMHVDRFAAVIENCLYALGAREEFSTPLGEEIKRSVADLPHVITDFYKGFRPKHYPVLDKNGKPYEYDVEKLALCPKFDGCDSKEQRAVYAKSKEVWWYGCNAPHAPYPGYHTDDVGHSARVIGWMMAHYGFQGNLYWATVWGQECNTTGKMLFVEDPYDNAHAGFGANGEGAILYPGKFYGVYGPIGTIRMKGIRDGNEDYELLQDLLVAYRERGADARALLNALTATVYQGTRIGAAEAHFETLRQNAVRLLSLAINDGVTLRIEADETFRVYVNGETAPALKTTRGGYADFCICGQTLKLYTGYGLKIYLLEELYHADAISGEIETVSLNPDEIYREITVKLAGGTLEFTLPEALERYSVVDLVVRVPEEVAFEARANGTAIAKGTIDKHWNRISLGDKGLTGSKITLVFSKAVELGIGEIYLFR